VETPQRAVANQYPRYATGTREERERTKDEEERDGERTREDGDR